MKKVLIYGEIGWDNTPTSVAEQLEAAGGEDIQLWMSSPGGSAFDGIAITNLLREYPGKVHTTVIGYAASAASFIAIGGSDHLEMKPDAEMMIHPAFTPLPGGGGTAKELIKAAAFGEKLNLKIAEIYQAKAGGDIEQWLDAMEEETWYSAEEALAAGLIDEIKTSLDKDAPSTVGAVQASNFLNKHCRYAGRSEAPAPRTLKDEDMDLTEIKNMLGAGEMNNTDFLTALTESFKQLQEEKNTDGANTTDDNNEDSVENTVGEENNADGNKPDLKLVKSTEGDTDGEEDNTDDDSTGNDNAGDDNGSDPVTNSNDDSADSSNDAANVPVDDGTVKVDADVYQDLLKKAALAEKASQEQTHREAVALVDEAIKAGKILPSKKDHLVAQATNDFAGIKNHLDGLMPGTIPTAEIGRGTVNQLDTQAHAQSIASLFPAPIL